MPRQAARSRNRIRNQVALPASGFGRGDVSLESSPRAGATIPAEPAGVGESNHPRLPSTIVLLTALAVRLWIVATHSYVVWPDETFQYLEPAHRLAFGSGVITWEFLDGVRSWFLPGILAGVMWLVALVDPDPRAYVLIIRLLCVLASLSVPFVAFRLAARRFGPVVALLTGLLCALASEAVYFAPVIMAEPLATDAALLAIWCGDSVVNPRPPGVACWPPVCCSVSPVRCAIRCPRTGRRRPAAARAVAPRPRYRGGWWHRGRRGGARRPRCDDLGTPFQSVWLNYLRNATQGVSSAMGAQAWWYLRCLLSRGLGNGDGGVAGLRGPRRRARAGAGRRRALHHRPARDDTAQGTPLRLPGHRLYADVGRRRAGAAAPASAAASPNGSGRPARRRPRGCHFRLDGVRDLS